MSTGPDFLDNLLAIRQILAAGTAQQLAANLDLASGFTFTTTTDSNGVTTVHASADGLVGPSNFGPSGNQIVSLAASLSTADATPTAFAAGGLPYTLADKSACDVIVTIIGKKAATGDVFCQDYRARYFRNGGAVTLIGSVIAGANPVGTGGLATASATILLSGNTIAPQVIGVAATSVVWTCTMQVQPVATAT